MNIQKSFVALTMAVIAIAALPLTAPSAAATVPQVMMLRSCVNTPTLPCIETIDATASTGQTIRAELTGVTTTVNEPPSYPNVTLDEYRLPGFTFESSAADRMTPRVWYRPYGALDCNEAKTNCAYDREEVQIVVEPSWLHTNSADIALRAVHMPHRQSDLLCGTSQAPALCTRPYRFNQDISFDIALRLPAEFITAIVNAQTTAFSLQQGLNPREIQDVDFATAHVRFTTVDHATGLFTAAQPDPLGTSDTADFMTDQTNIWLQGTRSPDGRSLGQCAGIPGISVTANSVYQSTPTWNAQTESVEVRLSSFHFLPNGTLNRGHFEARISLALGKCLWGVDLSTKTRARVAIFGEQGATEIAVESSRFDGEDFILTATNFHYSSPTISFRLEDPATQPKPLPDSMNQAQTTPKPENATSSKPPKKTTIICVQGKRTKKVTASKPKCPTGWKRK